MIILETRRLTLRSLLPKDAAVMFDYRNNEICARYQRGQTKDYDKIAALIERHQEDLVSVDAPFMLAAALKESDEMIGEIVLIPKEGTITMGYTFSYRYHRRGYAFEALSALLELLHKRFPDWDFICFTEPENEPSMALLKKLGYEHLGYAPPITSQVYGKWLLPGTREQIAKAAAGGESPKSGE